MSTSLRTPPLATRLGRSRPPARPRRAFPILAVWAVAVAMCLAFWAGVVVLAMSLL